MPKDAKGHGSNGKGGRTYGKKSAAQSGNDKPVWSDADYHAAAVRHSAKDNGGFPSSKPASDAPMKRSAEATKSLRKAQASMMLKSMSKVRSTTKNQKPR